MTRHIIEFHYQFIEKWWKQRDSDSDKLIMLRSAMTNLFLAAYYNNSEFSQTCF